MVGNSRHYVLAEVLNIRTHHVEHTSNTTRRNPRLLGQASHRERNDAKWLTRYSHQVVAHSGGKPRQPLCQMIVQKLVPLVGLIIGVFDVFVIDAIRHLVELQPLLLDVAYVGIAFKKMLFAISLI